MLPHRRRFLQASVAAGAAVGLGPVGLSGSAPSSPTPAAAGFTNPAVRPGRVRWHADFASACAAAERSRKPVFLLQMLGRLDQRFC